MITLNCEKTKIHIHIHYTKLLIYIQKVTDLSDKKMKERRNKNLQENIIQTTQSTHAIQRVHIHKWIANWQVPSIIWIRDTQLLHISSHCIALTWGTLVTVWWPEWLTDYTYLYNGKLSYFLIISQSLNNINIIFLLIFIYRNFVFSLDVSMFGASLSSSVVVCLP